MDIHEKYMKEALKQAKKAYLLGEVPVLLSMKEKSLAGDITAGIRIKIHCPMRRLQPSARPAKKWGTGGWKAAPSM